MPARRQTQAERLIAKVLATGSVDHEALAEELVVTRTVLDNYLTGTTPIPLDRQACLATFVIERVPALMRFGHQLRGQVRAALAYNAGETATHMERRQP